MGQGVKDVEQKGTRVEKFEKNFKNSSERKKVRQSQEETRKESTNMVLDVADVCRTCNNVSIACNNLSIACNKES